MLKLPTWAGAQDLGDILDSIRAHTEHLPNVAKPVELDAAAAVWDLDCAPRGGEHSALYGMILAVNVTHIAPSEVTQGIIAHAGTLLRPVRHACRLATAAAAASSSSKQQQAAAAAASSSKQRQQKQQQ